MILGGASSVAYIGPRSYHGVHKINNGQIVDRTYDGSCPLLNMIMSQGEVWTIGRDETEFGMASRQVTFPPLPKVSDLVIHCHVTRENVGLFPSLAKEYKI